MSRILGIDIGGTHVRWGIVEEDNIINVHKSRTKDVKDFVEFISDIVTQHNDIDMISIGIPGIVNRNKIINVPNVELLNIPDLDIMIQEKTNKNVIIHRDVRLLFAYDLERLHLKEKPYVIAFYLGTGVGNVIKVEGKIVRGSHGFSAELGHIPVSGNDKLCGCGKIGCSETIVSGKALVEIYHHYHLSGDFSDIFVLHHDHDALIEFIEGFARMIAIEMNILDTTTIIIGGGVTNMKGFPKERLSQLLIQHLRSVELKDDFSVYYVDDSPMNSIIGAALLAKELENENSNR